jgi:hypothetical protein
MIGRNVAIYVAVTPTDMRKSFDGLAAAAREALRKDPESGRAVCLCKQARTPRENPLVGPHRLLPFAKTAGMGSISFASCTGCKCDERDYRRGRAVQDP